MCGRFTLTKTLEEVNTFLENQFETRMPDIDYEPRYNIAPTQDVIALIFDGQKYRAGFLPWGMPFNGSEDKKNISDVINARAESLSEKPFFSALLQNHRCLVVMDGYYEWKREGKPIQPYYFTFPNHGLFVVAGLYKSWMTQTQDKRFGASLITLEASDNIKQIHDRMPAILSPSEAKNWLTLTDRRLNVIPKDLTFYEVSPLVNKATVDDQCLIKQYKSPSLF